MAKAEIEVNNIDKEKPEIELEINPLDWTNGNIVITWQVKDEQSGVREIVTPDGTVNDIKISSYTITENAEYTIIAYDNVGNETIKKITIKNIDRVNPTIKLSKEKLSNGSTKIKWELEDDVSGIREIILPNNEKIEGKSKGEFIVDNVGTFAFVAFDKAGNYAIEAINVD